MGKFPYIILLGSLCLIGVLILISASPKLVRISREIAKWQTAIAGLLGFLAVVITLDAENGRRAHEDLERRGDIITQTVAEIGTIIAREEEVTSVSEKLTHALEKHDMEQCMLDVDQLSRERFLIPSASRSIQANIAGADVDYAQAAALIEQDTITTNDDLARLSGVEICAQHQENGFKIFLDHYRKFSGDLGRLNSDIKSLNDALGIEIKGPVKH
jgi:hypothetical protein